jgi:general stress protein YciG
MAENKKSFVLYCDLIHTVEKLPDDIAGKLFKLILNYTNDNNPEVDDVLLSVAFEPIKRQLKRDLRDWEQQKQKRVDAGRKGGKVTQSKFKQNQAMLKQNQAPLKQGQANQADTVTVTVNDTVNVNDTVTVTNKSNSPTIEMCRQYFDSRGYVEEFADKFFHYYNSLNWINKKGFEVSKVWRNSAELWFGDKDAIQYKKEEEMDAYEKQEAHIKKLKEEARRWG